MDTTTEREISIRRDAASVWRGSAVEGRERATRRESRGIRARSRCRRRVEDSRTGGALEAWAAATTAVPSSQSSDPRPVSETTAAWATLCLRWRSIRRRPVAHCQPSPLVVPVKTRDSLLRFPRGRQASHRPRLRSWSSSSSPPKAARRSAPPEGGRQRLILLLDRWASQTILP